MNTHDATEQAYRNGYEAGYKAAKAEIVRCKDCKHYSPDNKKGLLHSPCDRIFAMSICKEDSFCSFGERKEDEK